jgi:hypothetical protein
MKYDDHEVKPLVGEELELVSVKVKRKRRFRVLDFALVNATAGLVISSIILAARVITML